MRQVLAFRRTLDESRRTSTCYLLLVPGTHVDAGEQAGRRNRNVPHGTQAQTWHDGREVRPGSRPVFQGRCRGAETSLETGLAHDATEPERHCHPAMDAAMQGQYLRAGQQCAEALRLAPDFPSVHVELAEILAAQRKTAGRSPGTAGLSNSSPTFPTSEQLGVGTRHQRGPPVPQRRRGGEHGRLRLRTDS